MAEFDLMDDAEEVVHPLCLCLNQDSSRVGVGHAKGYVVYRVHRHNTNVTAAGGGGEKSVEGAMTSLGTPFCTTVEVVFPQRRATAASTPTSWDVALGTPQRSLSARVRNERGARQRDEAEVTGGDPLIAELTQSPTQPCLPGVEGDDVAGNQQQQGGEAAADGTAATSALFSSSSMSTLPVVHSTHLVRPSSDEQLVPTEAGVGVMALLYKTQFVAVVGGGPYPIGPGNVVKLFVTGSMWADRQVRVPDTVEGLRLDHRLIIILTTAELRLHSFETQQCVFSLPLRKDAVAPGISSGLGASGSVAEQWQSGAASAAEFAAAMRHLAPLAIDYGKKCLSFRSSARGFSLVRYDAESSMGSWMGAELLATVPFAHEHRLASLTMDLSTLSGCKRWHIATSSEHATLIRIWRYCERTDTSSRGGDASAPASVGVGEAPPRSDGENDENQLPGYFVKLKQVRNATLPTPIYQMQFLGEAFLFCISGNMLKVFFVGEREEAKPYDVSTKDPSKVIRAQNNHSSLHHLGVVSEYFQSEWAACECLLPLTDNTFLPKWVQATTGAQRLHLLRGLGSLRSPNEQLGIASREQAIPPADAGTEESLFLSGGSQCQGQMTQSVHSTQHAEFSLSGDWGSGFRRYVSQQVVPVMESASRIAMSYWVFGGGGQSNSRSSGAAESQSGCAIDRNGGADGGGGGSGNLHVQRDYTTVTEVAQSLVVWWERPAYWQLDRMINASTQDYPRTGGETGTGGVPVLLQKQGGGKAVLYCVTCDGSAVSFVFDPIVGTIECSRAAEGLSCSAAT
ncbi:hypothetical protein DQ04_15811000 [Trypanosoma grayi]|uniref:hypothetical protein n=1 Tax=Trypanosoma grayi TaxID=71804 RepID=UPI0004F4AF1C|nr:hypothetical protein DQ04_15811000 [Trypanosoma grayi]KEG06123.1 hypothetical protein DQ04_15811000 [Trypanosoma grayi]